MNRKTKTGSSRRKGDEYQDLTALQLALELYINGTDFELFIEYEKAGAFDDVLVVSPDRYELLCLGELLQCGGHALTPAPGCPFHSD